MSVFTCCISDKDPVKLYVQLFRPNKITLNLNISAKTSWSISEILKPFKKLAIHGRSFFKHYLTHFITLLTVARRVADKVEGHLLTWNFCQINGTSVDM